MKPYFFYLVIGLTLFFSGCGGLVPKAEHMRVKAQYGEMERYLEAKEPRLENHSGADLKLLCTAYAKVKRYDKLFVCLQELKTRIDREESQVIFLGFTIYDFRIDHPTMLAQAYLELGNYTKAIEYADKALEAVNKYGSGMQPVDERKLRIDALTVLGLAHALSGDKQTAAAYAHDMEMLRTSFPYGLIAYEQYTDIAKINMAIGNYDKALQALKWDESAFTKSLANATTAIIVQEKNIWIHSELPRAYMLCKVMLETGDIAGARTGLDELLKIPQIDQNGEIFWMILFDRGRIAELDNDLDLAGRLYHQAIEAIEIQRSTIHTEVSKIGFVGEKLDVYRKMVALQFRQRHYAGAFEYVEKAKSRALVDLLASRDRLLALPAASRQTGDLLARLENAESAIRVKDETVSSEEISRQRGVAVKIKQELRRVDPELASLVSVSALETGAVRQLLAPDETLIEYFDTGTDLYAFVVTRAGITGRRLQKNDLHATIADFRQQIADPRSGRFKAAGKLLYDILVRPLVPDIGTNKVTIVPHGTLHYLPFNALIADNRFLIERYHIRVLPSASVMQFLAYQRQGRTGELIAFGNPDRGDPKYDLPFAQYEAVAIAKGKSDSRVLLRDQASETAVKEYSGQFRMVHLACHGTFNPEKPLDSGLLLAGDNSNDGMLTVGELYDLQLNADLVTLSACETALGKIANGDDVVGFTRGFLYAGTNSIVSSLWQVDDRATSILMQAFYRLLGTQDKRSALREAQLKVKETYNTHPYYWAAFQLTGSGR